MAINKTILVKLKEKTNDDAVMCKFLTEIIEFESTQPGWFEKDYLKILDAIMMEES
jgi:hypothetical protein